MAFGVPDLVVEPADARSACATAESFLRDWMPEVKLGSADVTAEVAAAESGLGQELPASLRWAYVQLGRRGESLFHQDPLVHIGTLKVDSHGVLPFRVEQQGCVEWGFRVGDGDDPPVLIRDNAASGPPTWEEHQARLSIHILEGVLSEAVLAGAHAANLELTAESLARFESLPRLGIPVHAMWTDPTGELTVTWRGQPEAIVRNDADTWLWALGRSRGDLLALIDAIPGAWTMPEP